MYSVDFRSYTILFTFYSLQALHFVFLIVNRFRLNYSIYDPSEVVLFIGTVQRRGGTPQGRTPAAGDHGMWRGCCFCEDLHC